MAIFKCKRCNKSVQSEDGILIEAQMGPRCYSARDSKRGASITDVSPGYIAPPDDLTQRVKEMKREAVLRGISASYRSDRNPADFNREVLCGHTGHLANVMAMGISESYTPGLSIAITNDLVNSDLPAAFPQVSEEFAKIEKMIKTGNYEDYRFNGILATEIIAKDILEMPNKSYEEIRADFLEALDLAERKGLLTFENGNPQGIPDCQSFSDDFKEIDATNTAAYNQWNYGTQSILNGPYLSGLRIIDDCERSLANEDQLNDDINKGLNSKLNGKLEGESRAAGRHEMKRILAARKAGTLGAGDYDEFCAAIDDALNPALDKAQMLEAQKRLHSEMVKIHKEEERKLIRAGARKGPDIDVRTFPPEERKKLQEEMRVTLQGIIKKISAFDRMHRFSWLEQSLHSQPGVDEDMVSRKLDLDSRMYSGNPRAALSMLKYCIERQERTMSAQSPLISQTLPGFEADINPEKTEEELRSFGWTNDGTLGFYKQTPRRLDPIAMHALTQSIKDGKMRFSTPGVLTQIMEEGQKLGLAGIMIEEDDQGNLKGIKLIGKDVVRTPLQGHPLAKELLCKALRRTDANGPIFKTDDGRAYPSDMVRDDHYAYHFCLPGAVGASSREPLDDFRRVTGSHKSNDEYLEANGCITVKRAAHIREADVNPISEPATLQMLKLIKEGNPDAKRVGVALNMVRSFFYPSGDGAKKLHPLVQGGNNGQGMVLGFHDESFPQYFFDPNQLRGQLKSVCTSGMATRESSKEAFGIPLKGGLDFNFSQGSPLSTNGAGFVKLETLTYAEVDDDDIRINFGKDSFEAGLPRIPLKRVRPTKEYTMKTGFFERTPTDNKPKRMNVIPNDKIDILMEEVEYAYLRNNAIALPREALLAEQMAYPIQAILRAQKGDQKALNLIRKYSCGGYEDNTCTDGKMNNVVATDFQEDTPDSKYSPITRQVRMDRFMEHGTPFQNPYGNRIAKPLKMQWFQMMEDQSQWWLALSKSERKDVMSGGGKYPEEKFLSWVKSYHAKKFGPKKTE